MKLSRNWLSEFVDIQASDKEYADKMTMSGSKVETTEALGAEIDKVVLGQVLSLRRHEDSDHLWVCDVNAGGAAPITIVTGAQNLREGDLVPVALHKSTLPGGVHIKKGKLRGVASEGMLCSLNELALDLHDFPNAAEDGILVFQADETEGFAPGEDIRPIIGRDDSVVEFEITNNRPDCFSVIGLARESAVTFDAALHIPAPQVKGSGGSVADHLDVAVLDAALCPRYTARVVRNIRIAPSPPWMRRRLRASGVRPINNIVDITNYVMLEYGQPMHAFDYDYIANGKIIVRTAHPGECLTSLDGTVRALTSDMLVIADEAKAVGLAGVMGGENSEITDKTTMVVFESANFDGACIRRTATRLGMRTESSARFEKGLDPLNTLPAIQRACELVELLGAGEVVDGVIDVIAPEKPPVVLKLDPEWINGLLGMEISEAFMRETLAKLGFSTQGSRITAPSWRPDIEELADIAEEIARFYGYDRIPATQFGGETVCGALSPRQQAARRLDALCRGMGFCEIYTYSFISPSAYDKTRLRPDTPLRNSAVILNPLGEDTSLMRTTALPSMLDALARNAAVQNGDVWLYEPAMVYLPRAQEELCDERVHLTLGAYGGDMDFFRLKGCVEALLDAMRISDAVFSAAPDADAYHPGRCARLLVRGRPTGFLGQIHPKTAKHYGLPGEVYCAELDFHTLFELRGEEQTYSPLPKYPAVSRDIAVVCDEAVTVAELADCIRQAGGAFLRETRFFDVYTGAPIPAGKKSVAFSLRFRADDRTLTDAHADEARLEILKALETRYNAVIR